MNTNSRQKHIKYYFPIHNQEYFSDSIFILLYFWVLLGREELNIPILSCYTVQQFIIHLHSSQTKSLNTSVKCIIQRSFTTVPIQNLWYDYDKSYYPLEKGEYARKKSNSIRETMSNWNSGWYFWIFDRYGRDSKWWLVCCSIKMCFILCILDVVLQASHKMFSGFV